MSTNTTQTDNRAELVFAQKVQAGSRNFYFNVKKAPESPPYLTIGQYAKVADEWVRLKLVVPATDAKAFYQGLCEALRELRNADETESQPGRRNAPAANDSGIGRPKVAGVGSARTASS